MKALLFAAMFLALACVNSSQQDDWLWQFVDNEEKDSPVVQKSILRGAKEIARLLLEKGEGEGEGRGDDEESNIPSPPTETPPTPASAQPTPSPSTPAAAQPTPSPLTSTAPTVQPTPSPAPPTPAAAQPTPSPPTSAAPTAQPTPLPPIPAIVLPTPSPPAPLAFRTVLAEAVNAGDKIIQVENATGLAVGMSLTISDDINLETKIIDAVTGGSGRRLVGRRLIVGSVTLNTALEHSYAAAAFVVAAPREEQTTKVPSTTTVTTTNLLELTDGADNTNPAFWIILSMQIAVAWSARAVA